MWALLFWLLNNALHNDVVAALRYVIKFNVIFPVNIASEFLWIYQKPSLINYYKL